jgi:4-amino-4-deoxy-L-arabinose transferase-like glycosyltransferase
VSRSRWPILLLAFLGLAIALRVALALRPGLWGDEIFSLAIATGHSLEQPAAEARPAFGDFVEPRGVVQPADFRGYLKHDVPPAGPRRVVRAVLLSDTNPPLYYLLLNTWTRLSGTGDGALRLFSVLWSVLALPFVWLIGNQLGGQRMAWSACLLFALSPVGLFYSVEGRMYSLLWFLASALAWQTLRLSRRGPRPAALLLWVVLAAAGLLTHYFFAFVCFALLGWLLLFARGWPRVLSVVALTAVTGLVVAPWYVQVPGSLARWRVSGNWLTDQLPWTRLASRPFELAWSLLAGGSHWGGSPLIDGCLAGLYLLLAIWIVRRGLLRQVFSEERLFLWGWVIAAVLGPVVFDVIRHTSASLVPRYVLAGFPAAMLLAAYGMSQLPPRMHAIFLSLVLLAWVPGAWPILTSPARPGAPYRAIDVHLESWVGSTDLILVHSIPSGVLGIARYFNREVPLASWIAPLRLREIPEDLELLLAGRRRVALVQVHNLAQSSPAEAWLRTHARLVRHEVYDPPKDGLTTNIESLPPEQLAVLPLHKLSEIFYFVPSEGETFFPPPATRR